MYVYTLIVCWSLDKGHNQQRTTGQESKKQLVRLGGWYIAYADSSSTVAQIDNSTDANASVKV